MSPDSLELAVDWRRDGFRLKVETSVPLTGTMAVIGPSGSGKTTLMRLIAGLERPDQGSIRFRGDPWTDTGARTYMPVHQRPVGYMFQDARLFPHLSVADNLGYAERRRLGTGPAYTRDDVISAVGIESLSDRRPQTLSGGERQRVALARTLLRHPDLLLLDEPLASVDPARKAETLSFIRRVLKAFDIPALYVTHDYQEVVKLADAVMVLERGAVTAKGSVTDVLNASLKDQTMDASGIGSVLEGQVGDHDPARGVTQVRLSDHVFAIPLDESVQTGDTIRLMIDPRDVAIAVQKPEGISIQNQLAGRIELIDSSGGQVDCLVTVRLPSGASLIARITAAARADLNLKQGQSVYALVKTVRVVN